MRIILAILVTISCLTLTASADDTVYVYKGWNIIGSLSDGAVSDILVSSPPDIIISEFYEYRTGYNSASMLKKGVGYWVKVSEDGVIIFGGTPDCEGYRITATAHGGGSINPSGEIYVSPHGDKSFTISPNAGYQTDSVVVDGVNQGVLGNYDFTDVIYDHTIDAYFAETGPPCPGVPTVEYGGKTYHNVQIGSQCWMRENLDIGIQIDGGSNQSNNGTIEKYCYVNDSLNCAMYGGLYTWNEAMQYSTTPGSQGICPPGWHIPTLAEFEILYTTVGGDGNALKAIGQGAGDGAGTNTSGFSALLGGGMYGPGSFVGNSAMFWSSSLYEDHSVSADTLSLYSHLNGVYFGAYDRESGGYSVRCIKD
jgi:uncharacterized protein (TIGR02145 family)